MGLDYAYQMWVPQERLYEFLETVNLCADERDGVILDWLDGRNLSFLGSDIGYKGDNPKKIALDCSFEESLCTSLLFEPDEVLQNNEARYFVADIGKYKIGCIYVGIYLEPKDTNWLDDESYCVRVSFTAATTGMSHSFRDSPSIRRLFVELAQVGGAKSCVLDCEGNDDRLLFLDGQEMDEKGSAYANLYDLRRVVSPIEKLTEKENRLWLCRQRHELSHHDLLSRIEWARQDTDSGIRAAACKSLAKVNDVEIEQTLCEIARYDVDWRVRYVATSCLRESDSIEAENIVFEHLNDENHQIQIAAIKALGSKKHLHKNLADELEQLLIELPFHGPTMGVFFTAMEELSLTWPTTGKPHHAQIIRQRMSEPDFPFEAEAIRAIERLEVWGKPR